MNLSEILRLKFPQVDFLKEIILQDDGQGIYIREWNIEDPRPTQKDLDKWATELDLQYRQQQAVLKRKYPPIGEQLDMMYKDKLNNTNIWVETITAIKAANPKPTV